MKYRSMDLRKLRLYGIVIIYRHEKQYNIKKKKEGISYEKKDVAPKHSWYLCLCSSRSFSGRTAHGVALIACLFSGRAGNFSLLPVRILFCHRQDFFSFSFRTSLVLIPKRKSSRNDFPWTPGIVRGVTRNLHPGIDCVNG